MGGSDFRPPPPASSLSHLSAGARLLAYRWPDLLGYRLLAMSGSTRPRTPGSTRAARLDAARVVACRRVKPVGTLPLNFRGSIPSRSASPVTLAPRLLSCLRINPPVAGQTARLDTGPVASGYPGGLPTHSSTRHRQAATDPISSFSLHFLYPHAANARFAASLVGLYGDALVIIHRKEHTQAMVQETRADRARCHIESGRRMGKGRRPCPSSATAQESALPDVGVRWHDAAFSRLLKLGATCRAD